MSAQTYDVTARKGHQATMAVLVLLGFVLGGLLTDWIGVALVGLAGLIMLAGRFWWPADVVRQFVWRVAEPRGLLPRRDRVEDHETRRIARVIGGVAWLVGAALIALGVGVVGWVIALLLTVMVVLDATLDFCALCFVFLHLERRGLLPAALRHQ